MLGDGESNDGLVEWLLELQRSRPDDRDIAFMLAVLSRDPLVLDANEEARLVRLSDTFPQGTRAILVSDAATRLLARARWR